MGKGRQNEVSASLADRSQGVTIDEGIHNDPVDRNQTTNISTENTGDKNTSHTGSRAETSISGGQLVAGRDVSLCNAGGDVNSYNVSGNLTVIYEESVILLTSFTLAHGISSNREQLQIRETLQGQ